MKHLKLGLQVRPLAGALMCMGILTLAVGCGPSTEPDTKPDALADQESEAVYGTDDRMDVHAHPNATLRARARQSTVALMHQRLFDTTDPNNVVFTGQTLGEGRNLCTTERFRNDPRAAFCSGTLIDDDLVLTAAHCVLGAEECANTYFVFNFYRTAEGALQQVTTQDIFRCTAIVAHELGNTNGRTLDYSILRLDRPATPRFTPAPVRTGNTALAVGQNVAVIGSGSGIPFKIDSGGTVRDSRADTLDFLVSTTDTFAGNSGSAVYETNNYTVASIVVRGEADYVANGTCNVVNRCPETGCIGEQSTYVYPAIRALCAATNNASPRLCAGMPPPPPRPATSFIYFTGNTNDAQQHTTDRVLSLSAGDVVEVGTCNLAGASATGDTLLRLIDAQGTQVASNDCYFKHRVGAAGDYTLRAGCHHDTLCGGAVVWKVTRNSDLVRGTFSFNLTNTSSGTRNTVNRDVRLSYGQVIEMGTCGLEGASGSGDTILRLHRSTGIVEAENDDTFGTCGSLSHLTHHVNALGENVPYQIRVGCFRDTSCSGTVAYVIY
ncbi:trypsin-like serine protease [Pyxidicoccus fallax]|uniref:Serine protease n=1 Tax=Pyxidicoccus fallax TaxID=394095 RepID=A0A848L878_9BACT|nr:serine protease [Pyxidicoccus fallax]NMO15200.1 trypsin-like serine protease [Pyxidicoccus fallax]NPC76899.1 trypsin-like serine protease [Pyxidicoccus fallax]